MLQVGCHLSSAQGYEHMGKDALRIGANVFQYFSRNPRGSAAKRTDPDDAAALVNLKREHKFGPLLVHAPYTLNPAAKDIQLRDFAYMVTSEDLKPLEQYLPDNYYVFHPGSHMGQGMQTGIKLIADLLDKILSPAQSTTVLLETMSGKGTEVGSRFEELHEILQRTEHRDKVGICLDTCHVFSAGYDIAHDLDGVLKEFDAKLGLHNLRAVHLNDSLTPFASHKDRHARLGEGTLGPDVFFKIINHPLLCDLPFYLETPNDLPGYAREIKMLKQARDS